MDTVGFRSVLVYTIPVLALAGLKATSTLAPECKPIPVMDTGFAIVR